MQLSLDADAQTEAASASADKSQSVQEQLTEIHLSLVSRIHELEILNYETQKKLDIVLSTLETFKKDWDRKVANEKDSDLLLRNIGILS